MPENLSNKRSHPEDVTSTVNKRMRMTERKQEMEPLSAKVTRNPVILEQIFSHLPPSDIKTVALVNRTWNSVVEQPRFWNWVKTRLTESNFTEILSSNRFGNISCTILDESDHSEHISSIFKYIVEHKDLNLKRLSMCNLWNLSMAVPDDIISKAVVKLEELSIKRSDLGYDTVDSIFEAIVEAKGMKLKNLVLRDNDHSEVSPSILSQSIVRLEKVGISELSDQQVLSIFRAIVESKDNKLRELHLHACDLSSVPADILSLAVVRLEAVNLEYGSLSPHQVSSMFQAIKESRNQILKRLYLHGFDLSSVSPDILSQAVVRLEEVKLASARLSMEQVQYIFRTIFESKNRILKRLDLQRINLSCVCPDILSQVVIELESVQLRSAGLSPGQLQSILQAVIESRNKILKRLDLNSNYLTSIPPNILSQAVLRLEDVDLSDTRLSANQVQSIFKSIVESKEAEDIHSQAGLSLKEVRLDNSTESFYSFCQEDLEAIEMKKIYGLNPLAQEFVPRTESKVITAPPTTPLLGQTILEAIVVSKNFRLKRLDLGNEDLTSVPLDIFSKAVARLEVRRWWRLKLTKVQTKVLKTMGF